MAGDEHHDIVLLENVELRFALAESDAQLQKMVDTFLVPILVKLESPLPAVRNKIMSLLAHINKRIKSKPNITLPVETLAKNFAANHQNNMVQNFVLVYIELGFERLDKEKAASLLPLLVCGLSRRSRPQQTKLLHIILQIWRSEHEVHWEVLFGEIDPFRVAENAADVAWLLEAFRDVVLYSPPAKRESTSTSPYPSSPIASAARVPPGLSDNAVRLVTNERKASWPANLQDRTAIKMGILRFLNSDKVFPDYLPQQLSLKQFFVFLAAACDSQHAVVSAGEDGLRRMKSVDCETEEAVLGLYTLYHGCPESTQPGDRRLPASATLQLRSLQYLQRSIRAANFFPELFNIIVPALSDVETSPKIRVQALELVNWVSRMADSSTLANVGKQLLEHLWALIDNNRARQGQDLVVSTAYVAIGQLCKRVPELITGGTFVLQRIFEALQTESVSVRTSVQEGLSIMLDAMATSTVKLDKLWSTSDLETIEAILEGAVQNEDHVCRYCAVKCAKCVFAFERPFARYICLLASADERLDVREAARQGLVNRPSGAEQNQHLSFVTMVSFVHTKSKSRHPRNLNSRFARYKVDGFPCEAYTQILIFLRRIMFCEAYQPAGPLQEQDVVDVGDVGRTSFNLVERESIRAELEELWNNGSLSMFIELLEAALVSTSNAEGELQALASLCLMELVSLGPPAVAYSFLSSIAWLKTFLHSPKEETRYAVARILGIVATSSLPTLQSSNDELLLLFDELLAVVRSQIKEVTLEHRHGALLALGTLAGRALYRRRYTEIPDAGWSLLEPKLAAAANELTAALASASTVLILAGSCTALGEAGRYSPLPLLEQDSPMPVEEIGKVEPARTCREVVDVLTKMAKSNGDTKMQERIIMTLAQLCLGDPTLAQPILDFCYWMALENAKQVDVHFTVGECVSCIAAGWSCTLTQQYLDIPGAPVPVWEQASSLAEGVLAKLQGELIKHPKARVRKAASVWMLCIVKSAAANHLVKQSLPQLYRSFSMLLADQDDFVQDIASKGVGLVYEQTESPDVKRELVQSLLSLFSEGKRLGGGTVDGETQIVDGNALGGAPDGSKIDTYQSILSLASDMHSPDLVYKFMQLASHNAVWQSRRGAAFGFASIMAKAEAEMQPYLTTLIPKLYRYQFDPIPKVNEAMSSIWKALVKDPKKAVDDQFDVIIQDIITNMGNNQWRIRQSSCLALANVLPGRDISSIYPYLEHTWAMSFRALDDIKESVRLAAFKACRALSNITIKYCDASVTSKDASRVIGTVIPFLLQKGIVSDAEEVRKFSLDTTLKICKKAGFLLRPHVSDVLTTLLEGLSTFEPQVMNYLSFHVEKHGISQEQLDVSRLSAAKTTPIMEGVEALVDCIDEKAMAELVPRLLALMRRAAGLPTKAGCAHVLATLAMRNPAFQQHADSVMKAISGVITDRSSVLRRSYATVVGHTVRLLPTTGKTLPKFLSHLRSTYLENPEDDVRSIAGITVLEITRHAQEQLRAVFVEIIPFAYFAARDADDKVKSTWQDVWDENTGGSTSAIRLYINELLDLSGDLLCSNSWSLKRQAASTIASVVKVFVQGCEGHAERLLTALTKSLAGRTWDGKEHVLEAYVSVCVACRDAFTSRPGTVGEMAEIVVREAKRNSKSYRRHAIDQLGRFLDAYCDVDVADSMKDELMSLVQAEQGEDDMDEDDAHGRPIILLLKASATRCLIKVLPKQLNSRDADVIKLATVLASMSYRNAWNLRVASLDSMAALVEKLDANADPAALEAILKSIIQGAVSGLNESKYAVVVESSLRVLTAVVEMCVKNPSAWASAVSAAARGILADSLQLGRFKAELEEHAKVLMAKLP